MLSLCAQSGLAQQEAAIQDALAKDPNAGRHEIQRQVCLCVWACVQAIIFHAGIAASAPAAVAAAPAPGVVDAGSGRQGSRWGWEDRWHS